MKASLKFRDEQHRCPLVRMKFPLSAPGIKLSSGIVLGDSQDLSLHIGTPAEASCPAMKLSYHPCNASDSSFCFAVKMGLGPWGPPAMASLSISAQLRFSRVSSSGPFFSVHVKPRIGDFGLRKTVELSSCFAAASNPNPNPKKIGGEDMASQNSGSEQDEDLRRRRRHGLLGMESNGFKAMEVSSHGFSNNTLEIDAANVGNSHSHSHSHGQLRSSVDEHSNRSIAAKNRLGNGYSSSSSFVDDAYRCKGILGASSNGYGVFEDRTMHAPSANKVQRFGLHSSTPTDCWANGFAKHDGDFDHTFASEGFERYSNNHHDASSEPESPCSSGAAEASSVGHGKHNKKVGYGKHNNNSNNIIDNNAAAIAARSLPIPLRFGSQESMKGWALHARSIVPLGKQAVLSFRWGVRMQRDGDPDSDPLSSTAKLPFLCLQKISISSSRRCSESPRNISDLAALQLLGIDEEDERFELSSPVVSLCGLMKKQLRMLHAENQGLRKAMKEMKAQLEQEIIGKPRIGIGGSRDSIASDGRSEASRKESKEGTTAIIKRPWYTSDDRLEHPIANNLQLHGKNSPTKRFSFFRWFGKRRSE